MSSYENKKRFSVSAVIAIVLAIVLVIGVVFGVGYNFGWFDKSDDSDKIENTDEVSIDNVVVNESKSTSKLSINSARTATLTSSYVNDNGDTVEYADGSITLTAEYNSNAISPSFTWASTDTTNITLKPSSDTISCVVTCNSAFSEQITITCTADDSGVNATCTVDYIQRPEDCALSMYVSDGTAIGLSTTVDTYSHQAITFLGNTTYINMNYWQPTQSQALSSDNEYLYVNNFTVSSYGTGTVTEDYTLSGYVNFIGNTAKALEYYVYTSAQISAGYKYYTYQYLYAASNYNPKTDLSSCYGSLYYNFNYGYKAATVTWTLIGSITGEEFTFSVPLYIDPCNLSS